MKKLFIYYSYTGNGEIVAKKFQENGFEIRKVSEKKKLPKSFFWGMMVGGFRSATNQVGKLVDYDNDISSYDEVVVGSPIWNGRTPPTTNGILKNTDFAAKKLTFVFYSGSGEGANALAKVNKLYPEAKVIFLKEPKKYNDELTKLEELWK